VPATRSSHLLPLSAATSPHQPDAQALNLRLVERAAACKRVRAHSHAEPLQLSGSAGDASALLAFGATVTRHARRTRTCARSHAPVVAGTQPHLHAACQKLWSTRGAIRS
jgi:hypothetical protein